MNQSIINERGGGICVIWTPYSCLIFLCTQRKNRYGHFCVIFYKEKIPVIIIMTKKLHRIKIKQVE